MRKQKNTFYSFLLFFLFLFIIITPYSFCFGRTPELTEHGIYAISRGTPIKLKGHGTGLLLNRPVYHLKETPNIVINDKKSYFMVSSPFPCYFSEQKDQLVELEYDDSKALMLGGDCS